MAQHLSLEKAKRLRIETAEIMASEFAREWVRRVAEALLERGRLNGEEVAAIITAPGK